MKRVNFLPNIITAFGLSCGLFVIFRITMSFEPNYELLRQMTVILIVAGVADLLDGAVARAIKAESEFGVLFDSLSDAVTFGVAPSIIFLKTLPPEYSTGLFSLMALSASMLYTICGVLRLVRFNVKAANPQDEPGVKKPFIGLPIPAAAASAVSITLLVNSPLFVSWFNFSSHTRIIIGSVAMLLIAYLMVSRLKFPSLKSVHFRVPSFNLILLTTFLAILLIYGFLYYLAFLLVFLSWGYALLGMILSIARMIAGRKSKHLKDFQPEDDDEEDLE